MQRATSSDEVGLSKAKHREAVRRFQKMNKAASINLHSFVFRPESAVDLQQCGLKKKAETQLQILPTMQQKFSDSLLLTF